MAAGFADRANRPSERRAAWQAGLITRRQFVIGAGSIVAAGAATSAYAVVIEPRFRLRVQTWRVSPPGWPSGARLRIVALADPHLGAPVMPLERWRAIVTEANALAPDLLVFLGDYTTGNRFVMQQVELADIAGAAAAGAARLGAYAIIGNHDWWADPHAQARRVGPTAAATHFTSAGIAVLENDAVRLTHRGQPFWLAGLGDQLALRLGNGRFAGVDDLPATLAKLTDDAPAILLAHEPDIFPRVPDRFALTLSGHTHGGQIRLFGFSPVVPSRYGNRYAYGHVVEAGRHLVVSGGLGCSIAPVRLGVPPEITVVEVDAPTAVGV